MFNNELNERRVIGLNGPYSPPSHLVFFIQHNPANECEIVLQQLPKWQRLYKQENAVIITVSQLLASKQLYVVSEVIVGQKSANIITWPFTDWLIYIWKKAFKFDVHSKQPVTFRPVYLGLKYIWIISIKITMCINLIRTYYMQILDPNSMG